MKISKFMAKFILALFTFCMAQGPVFAVLDGDTGMQELDRLEDFTIGGIASGILLYNLPANPNFGGDDYHKLLAGIGSMGVAAGLAYGLARFSYSKLPDPYKHKIRDAAVKVGRLISPKTCAMGLALVAGWICNKYW